jgi:tetratricopeptide (TPR) repeat protein
MRFHPPATGGFLLKLCAIFAATLAIALTPGDLHHQDPLIPALYHTEPFQGGESHIPNTLEDSEARLQQFIQTSPQKPELYVLLAEVNVKQLKLNAAETNMKLFVQKASNKDVAYAELEKFYHDRLRFQDELNALQDHARALPAAGSDITNHAGRYAVYEKMRQHIVQYGGSMDARTVYMAVVESYPDQKEPYLEFVNYLRNIDKKSANEVLEKFHAKFPTATNTYLLTKASLVSPEEGADLLNQSFHPLWDQELIRSFDTYLTSTGKKREYLNSIKERLQKDALDIDAVARLFHAYHLAGNLAEAQNTLNDYKLLKEQKVQTKQSSWNVKELYWMALLNRKLLNYNEAARFYYALYAQLSSGRGAIYCAQCEGGDESLPYKNPHDLSPDLALRGIFEVLLAAEDRPVQLGSGNLDYYRDIAAIDQNPGFLNGILSLILNGTDLAGEFQQQEDKANGYFNRAEALRLVRFTSKTYPNSRHLTAMYRDSLRVFEKYGMDRLLAEAGEEFFQRYKNSNEVLEVGVSVADAYARLKDYEKEWKTYQFLLPIAAARSESADQINYSFLLSRYIASLTAQKKHLEVIRLYKEEISAHPDDQKLYENFASYLDQNQLFDQQKELYKEAIARFQNKGWYEKLARWYLRFERDKQYQKLSEQMMDIFRGTEIEAYLQQTAPSNQISIYIALNLYAHQKFPLNLQFPRNLMQNYAQYRQWDKWEALAAEYYFLDDWIRTQYLAHLSRQNKLQMPSTSNAINIRFSGDIAAWRSHFEEATAHYQRLSETYPADPEINSRLADLKRSLGVQNIENYLASAKVREHLANITPSDSTLWTAAGEILADIERYDDAGKYWDEILKIDPYNPERYIEVATIYWDYYLFDRSLDTIAKIRKFKNNETLFAYEAGAIYESKRDYQSAIREYAKSLPAHSEMAWNRLGELYERKKYTGLIRQQLDHQLQQSLQNQTLWTGTIAFYEQRKEKDLVRGLLTQSSKALNAESFHAIADSLKQTARNLGFKDIQEKLIARQISEAESDVDRWNRTLELAGFHEVNHAPQTAEGVYAKLYNEQPHSVGIIQELLEFYWRTEQYGKAFDVYKKTLADANPVWRKKYLAEITSRYRERKDFAPALIYARQLLETDPLNSQNFQLLAKILAEQKDYPALVAHYKEGLQKVRDAKLTDEEKKQRIAELRHGVIQANIILQDYTAALDQYIEIINKDAESEPLLKEAADFAAHYNLNARLFDYYTKTAAASPKDHRWPMVLGRLHLYSGDFEPSIRQFETAISIHPERTDFYQQVAESYQRLGRYEQAIQEYEKLYEFSYKNKSWLGPMAELHARLGHIKKALQLYSETLGRLSNMQQNFDLAKQALKWGLTDQAVAYGKSGLDIYLKDMDVPFPNDAFENHLESLIRSGKILESFSLLNQISNRIDVLLRKATFHAEELRSAQYMIGNIYGTAYPQMLLKYCTQEDWEKLEAALFAHITAAGGYRTTRTEIEQHYLPMVRAAKMAPAEERMLSQLTSHYRNLRHSDSQLWWRNYYNMHEQLAAFYRQRHEYARGAAWMEAEFDTYPYKADYREELVTIAEFYRLAEMTANEISALRKYYRFGVRFELQPAPVKRYLDLLYANKMKEEIRQAAAAPNLISANYFLDKKDKGMAIVAIQTLHQRRNKNDLSWQTIHIAMIGYRLREGSDFFDQNFRNVLEIKTIGELMEGADRDITKTLEGDDWFFFTKKYGEYLYWTNRRDEAAAYLPVDLERLSTTAAYQEQLGVFYSNEKLYEPALQHYSFALQLDPKSLSAMDQRARALIALGKKEEAIRTWRELIHLVGWNYVIPTAVEFGLMDTFKNEIETFLMQSIQKNGASATGSLLELYIKNISEASRENLIAQWIPAAPAPMQFGRTLLTFALGLNSDSQIYAAVNEYLQTRLLTAAGQELEVVRNDWWGWNERYVELLMNTNCFDSALKILSTAQERFESTEDTETKSEILLLRAKVLRNAGRNAEILQLIKDYTNMDDPGTREERYRKVLEALKGNDALQIQIKEEMYSWLLSIGKTEDANYVGFAEVKLQKGELDPAKEALRKMIYLNSENLDGFHSAASLLEKYKFWQEALSLRQELLKRKSWDETNRAHLSDDLLQVNQKGEAAKVAQEVLTSADAAASDRALAANVYGKSSSGIVGPPEMVSIEKAVRGFSVDTQKPYAHFFRLTVLDFDAAPSSKTVKAELFLDPQNENLQLQLFRALVQENKWAQALQTLDPLKQRFGNYVAKNNYYEDEEYGNYDGDYPVKKLKLSDAETESVALQMAKCAAEVGEPAGELFFLKMARADNEKIAALEKEIRRTQEIEANTYRITWNIGRN